jgi:hypothetical protein
MMAPVPPPAAVPPAELPIKSTPPPGANAPVAVPPVAEAAPPVPALWLPGAAKLLPVLEPDMLDEHPKEHRLNATALSTAERSRAVPIPTLSPQPMRSPCRKRCAAIDMFLIAVQQECQSSCHRFPEH